MGRGLLAELCWWLGVGAGVAMMRATLVKGRARNGFFLLAVVVALVAATLAAKA